MSLSGLGTALNLLSAIIGGGGASQKIILSCGNEKITLPVTPAQFEVSTAQGNKIVGIVNIGEALIFGMPKLKRVSMDCFFPHPSHDYPFVVGDAWEPSKYIELITKWKESRSPVRVLITDAGVNLVMGIMNFDYKKKDGTGDMYYRLSFTEYKELNTPAANNDKSVDSKTGLKERGSDAQKANTATMVTKASDVLDTAKKAYGAYNKWRRIAEGNNLKDLAINNVGKLRKLVVK